MRLHQNDRRTLWKTVVGLALLAVLLAITRQLVLAEGVTILVVVGTFIGIASEMFARDDARFEQRMKEVEEEERKRAEQAEKERQAYTKRTRSGKR